MAVVNAQGFVSRRPVNLARLSYDDLIVLRLLLSSECVWCTLPDVVSNLYFAIAAAV